MELFVKSPVCSLSPATVSGCSLPQAVRPASGDTCNRLVRMSSTTCMVQTVRWPATSNLTCSSYLLERSSLPTRGSPSNGCWYSKEGGAVASCSMRKERRLLRSSGGLVAGVLASHAKGGGGKGFLVGDSWMYSRMAEAFVVDGAGSGGGGALGAEMNLFERLFRIVRASLGSVVSSFEDPERILDQAVEEMGTDLAKLRSTTAQVVASRRVLENKYNAAASASADWYRRAKRALELGDEALAKEALKRRKTFEESATNLKAQLDQQQAVSDRILSSSRLLEAKISEAREKKNLLKARAQSAKTTKWVGEMVSSVDTSSALAAYERMEEKVLQLEAEADAVNQISTDSLETKFAALEAGSVDDELAELRREVLGSPIKIQRKLPPFETINRDNIGGSGRSTGSSYRSY